MVNISLFTEFYTSQVVPHFFHQQYVLSDPFIHLSTQSRTPGVSVELSHSPGRAAVGMAFRLPRSVGIAQTDFLLRRVRSGGLDMGIKECELKKLMNSV